MHRNRTREGGSRQSYYELFKACRLCGSGGGYKMPIVQGAPSSQHEPELRLKIRDCCSIDVKPDDRMPPLICELCVDKVNDFYEFREMCLQTNVWVRASLGLPPQTLAQDSSEDCILGVSGPLIYDSREYDETPVQTRGKTIKKEKIPPKKVKINPEPIILEKHNPKKANPQSLLAERKSRKRNRSVSPPPLPPIKKIKITNLSSKKHIQISNRHEKPSPAPAAKSKTEQKKVKESAAKKSAMPFECNFCTLGFTKKGNLKHHLVSQHSPVVFSEKLGCTPCREWFATIRLAEEHHKWHKLTSTFYRCDRCSGEFKVLQSYNRHFSSKQCIPENIVPDPVCTSCEKSFVTKNILNNHVCMGLDIGEECPKCKKRFTKRIQLRKHQRTCINESPNVNPNNPHLKMLKPIQIAVPKCDELLKQIKREPVDIDDYSGPIYDVSGLDPMNVIVKIEPLDDNFDTTHYEDVDIKHEIKEECLDQLNDCDGVNHDDDSDSDSDSSFRDDANHNPFVRKDPTLVESLSLISLRSLFNDDSMKKKPKPKKRTSKVKSEYRNDSCSNMFDSLLGKDNDFCMNDSEGNVTSLIITSVRSGHIDSIHPSEGETPIETEQMFTNSNDSHAHSKISNDSVSEDNMEVDNSNDKTVLPPRNEINSPTFLQSSIEPSKDILESSTPEASDKTIDMKNNSDDSEDNKLYEMTCSALENLVENNDGKDSDSFDLASQSVDDVLGYKDADNDEDILNNFNIAGGISESIENEERINSEKIETKSTNNESNEDQSNSENNINPEISIDDQNTMISNSNAEIDFEINKILQGDVGILETKNRKDSDSSIPNDKNSSNGINRNGNMSPIAPETRQEEMLNILSDNYLSNEMKSDEVPDKEDKKNPDVNLKPDQEVSNEKSENDVFDLVSDSGDDCNIIDSPEKMKAIEDQLLAEEEQLLADDMNINNVSCDDFEFGIQPMDAVSDSASEERQNFIGASEQTRYNGRSDSETRSDEVVDFKNLDAETVMTRVEAEQSTPTAEEFNLLQQ